MMLSLLAAFAIAGQPAPAEPVASVAVEAEVEAQVETPTADAEAEAETQAVVAAQPEEDIVCRRRLRPADRIGQRHRVVRDCRPRSDWESSRRGN